MNPDQPAPTQPGTQQPAPLPPPGPGDLIGLGVLATFMALFLAGGVRFVRKQRAEKRETLTRELQKPLEGGNGEDRQLPPPSEEALEEGEAVAPTGREKEPVAARPRKDDEA